MLLAGHRCLLLSLATYVRMLCVERKGPVIGGSWGGEPKPRTEKGRDPYLTADYNNTSD